MDKLKKWLLHNRSLKIISAILAFGVWLVISNTANPEKNETVSVPVTILNENVVTDNNKVFSTDRSAVNVIYRIRANDVSKVKVSDFYACVDFNEMSSDGRVPVSLKVSAEALEYIEEYTVTPSSISVHTENIQQKKFAVGHTVTGQAASGYVAGSLSVNPEYFYVKGPVSIVGQISSTGISVDISDATENITGTAEIVFYDANGNVLTNIANSLSYAGGISYSVPVYRTKSLSVNAFTGGSPASGYYVEGVETSPTFLSVYGTEEELKNYSYVLIPGSDLNINGISKNTTVTVNADRYLPEGLSLVQPNTEIVVYIKIRDIPESEAPTTEPPTTAHVYYPQPTTPPPTEPVTEPEGTTEETVYESESESYEETDYFEVETDVEETDETDTEPESDTESSDETEAETEEESMPETEASHGDDI